MKSKLKAAKNNYFSKTLPNFLKSAPQKFWNYLNPKRHDSPATDSDDNRNAANSFNSYFQSVFNIDNGKQPNIVPYDRTPIKPLEITDSGLLNLLLNIDTKKAIGPDNIPNMFLKRYAEWNSKYLCHIFNKSLKTCSLPSEWKIAKIIPIHKCGSTSQVSNFRPISLTSTVCKLLEHAVLKHINTYLEQESILSPYQHGFRRGLSTVTQLLELTHDISQSLDYRKQTDLILLDYSKAFDCVPHKKLIRKLQCTIGEGPIVNWIENYMSDRLQFVHIHNENSTLASVTSGVPQGSVLGPVLFLLYINDLPSRLNIRLFADDCILYREINSTDDHHVLNNALESVFSWCKEWQMTLNAKKSVTLTVARKKAVSDFTYTINDTPLTRVFEHKYLGVTLTHDLRWETHVNNITSNALKRLFFLRRRLHLAPPNTKLLAYKMLVRPVLEYANIAWFPYTKELIARIEGVQRKAVKFIYNKYRQTDSPTQLLHKAGLSTLQSRAKIARLKFLFQLIHGDINIDASKLISFSRSRLTRCRHSQTLNEYTFHSNCFKYSYFPQTIRDWNQLSPSVTNTSSLNVFLEMVEANVHAEQFL